MARFCGCLRGHKRALNPIDRTNLDDVCNAWAQKKYGSKYKIMSVDTSDLKVMKGKINYVKKDTKETQLVKQSAKTYINRLDIPVEQEFSDQNTKKYTCVWTKTKGLQLSGGLSVTVGLPAAVGLSAKVGGQLNLSDTETTTSGTDETAGQVTRLQQPPRSTLVAEIITTEKVVRIPYSLSYRLQGNISFDLEKYSGTRKEKSVDVAELYKEFGGRVDANGKTKSVVLTSEGTLKTSIEVHQVVEMKEPDADKVMKMIHKDLLNDNREKIAEEVSDKQALPRVLRAMAIEKGISEEQLKFVSQKSSVKERVDELVNVLKIAEPETFLVFVDILQREGYSELVKLLDPRGIYPNSVRHISNLSGVVDHYSVTKKEREVKDSLESARGVILHGMPGSGKTQMAYKVASDYARVHPHSVVWVIDGSSEEKLKEGIANLQQRLGGESNVDISLFQSLVSRWKHFFLLINDLSPYPQVAIPTQVLSSSAKMIVTTQDSLMEFKDVAKITIDGFMEKEAVDFLSPKMPPGTTEEQMIDLANIFSCLPLGLAAARASIHRGKMTVEEYKQQLQGGREAVDELMKSEDPWLQMHYRKEHQAAARNIFAALQLAIDKLDDPCEQEEERKCKVMLQPCAFLEPNNIPVLMLKSALESSPTIGTDAYFTERMRMYSLGNIEGAGVKRRLSIHGVTQMAIRLHMDKQQQTTCINKVLQVLVKFFVKDATYSEVHKFSLELMPHVKTALNHADKLELIPEHPLQMTKARLLMVYGHLLIEKGTTDSRLQSEKRLVGAKRLLLKFAGIPQDTASDQSLDPDAYSKELYQSLADKSQSLEDGFIEDTVIRRIIAKHHLSAVRDHLGAEDRTTLKNMVENFEPLTMEMYNTLVHSDLVISIETLKKVFLQELYISIMFTLSKALFDLEGGYSRSSGSGSGDRCNLITLALDMCNNVTNKTGSLVMVRYLADFILLRGVKVTDKVISRVPDTVEPILSEAAETLLIVHETKEKDAATRSYDSGLLVRCGGTLNLHELNHYANKQAEEGKRLRLFSWRQDKKRGKEMMKPVERSQAECYMIHGVVKVVVRELEEAAEMFQKAYSVELEREEYHPRMGDALTCLIKVHIAKKELKSARDWAEQYLQLAKKHWPEQVPSAEEDLRNVCSMISTH